MYSLIICLKSPIRLCLNRGPLPSLSHYFILVALYSHLSINLSWPNVYLYGPNNITKGDGRLDIGGIFRVNRSNGFLT